MFRQKKISLLCWEQDNRRSILYMEDKENNNDASWKMYSTLNAN